MAAQIATRARRAGLEPVASEQFDGRPDTAVELARRAGRGAAGRGHPRGPAGAGHRFSSWWPSTTRSRRRGLFASSGILAGDLSVPAGPARLLAVGPALSAERSGYAAMRARARRRERGPARPRAGDRAARRVARGRPDERIGVYRPGRTDASDRPQSRPEGEIFSALSRGVASAGGVGSRLGCRAGWSHSHRRECFASTLAGSFCLPARRLRPGHDCLRRRRRRGRGRRQR